MSSFDDSPSGPGTAHGSPAPAPAPPAWVSPEHPWSSPAPHGSSGTVGAPTSPPLAGESGGGAPPWGGSSAWGPPPPPPRSGPSAPSTPRRFLLAVVAALAIGGLLGAGLGKAVHLQGARPTLNTLSPSPTTVPGGRFIPNTPFGGTSAPKNTATIAANVNPSIVDVNTVSAYQGASGAGTGMIVTSSGDILTNNHVVDGATSISVTFVSTGRSYKAEVVGTSPTQDVAVIHVNGLSGLRPITIGNSAGVAVNDGVIAIGNAGGAGGTPAVVTGTVLAVNQTITASDSGGQNPETLHGLIRTNAPIQPGDSGGALVDTAGKVIGMNTAASASRQFSGGTSEGFAIPIAKAVDIAHQIQAGKESATVHIGLPGFLGISIEPVAAGQSANGAVIAGVENGSPAGRAGLTVGDTITSIDGRTVTTPDSLSAVTKAHHGGDRVTIVWTGQDGNTHSARVTLADGPAD